MLLLFGCLFHSSSKPLPRAQGTLRHTASSPRCAGDWEALAAASAKQRLEARRQPSVTRGRPAFESHRQQTRSHLGRARAGERWRGLSESRAHGRDARASTRSAPLSSPNANGVPRARFALVARERHSLPLRAPAESGTGSASASPFSPVFNPRAWPCFSRLVMLHASPCDQFCAARAHRHCAIAAAPLPPPTPPTAGGALHGQEQTPHFLPPTHPTL